MTKNLIFLLGGVIALALFLREKGSPRFSFDSPHSYQAALPLLPKELEVSGERSSIPSARPVSRKKSSSVQTGKQAGQKPSSKERTNFWSKPPKIVYWDQIPEQKEAAEYFYELDEKQFLPREEPIFVGVNDQGFEQYEYQTTEGEHVVQWKRSNETVIEEIVLSNGDKITRKAPESGDPVAAISYESPQEKSSERTTYRQDGSIETWRRDQDGRTILYYYDDQGRLTDIYDGPQP